MRNLDEWIAFISTHVPEPLERHDEPDGWMTFTGGDPGEVIVRLSPKMIIVLEYAIAWDTQDTPRLAPRRIGVAHWRRARTDAMVKAVGALIAAARESRRSKFRVCELCDVSNAPERMHGDRCQECANRQVKVID